jgi:hypothetical protein
MASRARLARPTIKSLTFGLVMFDYDLDGNLDIAIANGHVERDIALTKSGDTFQQRPQLFRGDGSGRGFDDASTDVGEAFAVAVAGRALAAADIDGDGDLDLLITGVGEKARILRNDGPPDAPGWIAFRAAGSARNVHGIGTRIELTAGGRKQHRWIRTGGSYLSQNDLVASFGLGRAATIDTLRIVWPDGTAQALDPAAYALNRIHTLARAR